MRKRRALIVHGFIDSKRDEMMRPPTPTILDIRDDNLGLIGHLAIDSTINNRSSGGIRILPDVSRNEIASLARNMTLKYGYWRIPIGGAKSCLLVSNACPPGVRDRYLSAFGRILAPLIRSEKYMIGFDMGTTKTDLERIHAAAGRLVKVRDSRTHVYTAWTVQSAADVAAKHVGLDLRTCRIAIEGFGKVGKAVAGLLHDLGATIVAVSTVEAAIYDPAGLNIPKLLELSQTYGDKFTCRYDNRRIAKRDLLRLPIDILIPCARPWSINPTNVGEIKATIICPGANVPMSEETENILHGKGILCIPDFLANSGGILGGYLESTVGQEKIRTLIFDDFAKQLIDILQSAQESNVAPGFLARQLALSRFASTKQKAERDILESRFAKFGLKLLPKGLKRLLAPHYFRRLETF